MRTTRTITAALCAVLGTAALAGPAAAGQQGADDSAKANVYVPPAAVYTATPSSDAAKANVYVPPATLYTAAPSGDAAKANVYVPPATLYTATPSGDAAKANVYVPPATLYTAAPAKDTAKANPTSTSSSDLDWDSAGIGAAAVTAAFLIALGGAAGVRRRRQIQPGATA
jgi:hypothetical protein